MSTLKAVIDFFDTDPAARERYLDVIIDILKFFESRGTLDESDAQPGQHRFAGSEAQSASVSDEQLTKYLEVLVLSGVFRAKPEAMALSKTVVELTGKTAQFADCAFVIQEFYSDLNEVARHTAQNEVSDKNKQAEKLTHLTSIWDRADEVTQASKGGRPTEGHVKRVETRIRLEPENVDWLKSKGPNHLSRINGLLTALREEEERQGKTPAPK